MNSQHTHLGARRKLFFSASTAQTPVVAAPRAAAPWLPPAAESARGPSAVRNSASATMHASNITFYQYEGRALHHGWLHNCALSDRAFLRDPMSAVRALRAISADEIARRKAALALHRADVLYDLRDSRAGDHFLAEVAEHCLPNLLPELAAENGWNRTALPAAPRLPASCGRAAAIARKLAT